MNSSLVEIRTAWRTLGRRGSFRSAQCQMRLRSGSRSGRWCTLWVYFDAIGMPFGCIVRRNGAQAATLFKLFGLHQRL